MAGAPHPRMHGITHVPGGPDPIPGLGGSGGGFPTYRDCVLADPTVVYYWECQDASGNLAETVGGSPVGTPVTWTTYPLYQQPGPFGDYAVEFAGSNVSGDRFDFTGTVIFDTIKNDLAYTIDMLVYANNDQAGRLFEYWGGTTGQWVFVDRDSSGQVSFTRTNGGNAASAATDVPVTAWTHLRFGHDGTSTYIYVNSVLASTSSSSTTTLTSSGTMAIGNNRTGSPTASPFVGRIAHLVIRNDWTTDFCGVITPAGPLTSTAALDGQVWTADGTGGAAWEYPTVEVEF